MIFQIKQRYFSRFFGGVTSLQGAHWVPEDNAEKRFFSAKKNKRAYDTTRTYLRYRSSENEVEIQDWLS
jgi:hypothetical protein